MFNRNEILFWVFTFIVSIMLAWSCRLEAEQVERKKIILKEWSTQLVYDTTNACYQGTMKWIVLSNPDLYGIQPGWKSQRQMLIHCFCVLDKIQKNVSIAEYQKKVFDEYWTGQLFMSKAVECIKEEKTLPDFFEMIKNLPEVLQDNETKVIPEIMITPKDKPEDSNEELPSPIPEESENGLPETIFQG